MTVFGWFVWMISVGVVLMVVASAMTWGDWTEARNRVVVVCAPTGIALILASFVLVLGSAFGAWLLS